MREALVDQNGWLFNVVKTVFDNHQQKAPPPSPPTLTNFFPLSRCWDLMKLIRPILEGLSHRWELIPSCSQGCCQPPLWRYIISAGWVGGWVGGGYQPLSGDRGSPLMKSLSTFSSTTPQYIVTHSHSAALCADKKSSSIFSVQRGLMRSESG